MISTARVPADKPVRIAFSLDNAAGVFVRIHGGISRKPRDQVPAGILPANLEQSPSFLAPGTSFVEDDIPQKEGFQTKVLKRLFMYDTPPEDTIPLVFPELEQQLQPLPPCHDSVESMQVYKQHCQIAEEYREVKKEIALLEERKKELIAKLDQAEKEKLDAAQLAREFEALTEENRTLKLAQSQCVEQLEKLRIQYQKRQGSS